MKTTVEDILFTMDMVGLDQISVTQEVYRRAELEGFPTDRMVVNVFLQIGMSDKQILQKESVKGVRNRWGGLK